VQTSSPALITFLPAALAKINPRRQGLERTMAQVSPQEQFFKIGAKDSLPGCI